MKTPLSNCQAESCVTYEGHFQSIVQSIKHMILWHYSQQKGVLENTLCETESCCCQQLGKLQTEVNKLEEELARMRIMIEHQDGEFRSLLNIKTRLEMEIAEYRRLLEGGDIQ